METPEKILLILHFCSKYRWKSRLYNFRYNYESKRIKTQATEKHDAYNKVLNATAGKG